MTSVIDQIYDREKAKFKIMLSGAVHYIITTDTWTDINYATHMGMTLHFLSDNRIKTTMMGTFELKESHTSAYFVEKIEDILTDFFISKDKLVAVVSDGASNIVNAVTRCFGSKKHVWCYAHLLQLVVNESVNATLVVSIIEKIKNIVFFITRKVNAVAELRRLQEVNGQQPLKLVKYVGTRWNSVFYMIQRFLKLLNFVGE